MEFGSPQFWIALLQIIGVNIVLSGDNAVVIALAARSLPDKQRKQAVLIGSGAAVLLRIALTIVAVELLRLSYLKLVGAFLLLYIGANLLVPEHEEAGGGNGAAAGGMTAAVRTILLADLVMSLDNVIAVAAAAKGSLALLTIGLLVSIPLVIFGSTLLMRLMERWPVIIVIGAALLGWVAGEMAVTDPATLPWIDANAHWLHYALPAAGALIVIGVGKWLTARQEAREDRLPAVDLAAPASELTGTPAVAAAGPTLLLVVADHAESGPVPERLIAPLRLYRQPMRLHVLNVQPPATGDVSLFVGEHELSDYHREQGREALQPMRELLERAGFPHVEHIGVGDPAHVVAHFARETGSEQILFAAPTTESAARMLSTIEHTATLVDAPLTLLR